MFFQCGPHVVATLETKQQVFSPVVRCCFSPAAVALAAAHARVELPQHNAWPSLASRRPPSPEECTLCVCRMLCASRPFERPLVPINTAVDPHELRFPRRMRRTRPAPACSASNLSRLMLTRVDVLWLECQWCRQRSHEDAAARCCAGPCPCIPDACSSRDLEAKERGCLRLSEDAERLFSRWATTVHLVCRSASCVRRM